MSLAQFFSAPAGRFVKLGRRQPPPGALRIPLLSYLDPARLPAPPASCSYAPLAMDALSKVMRNDALGDCVIAAGYHVVGVETGNAKDPFVASDDQVTADYEAIGGFDPADPEGTDNGCDEVTAFAYWQQHGFANGTRLLGWVGLDASDAQQVKSALYLFESVVIGLNLPQEWLDQAQEKKPILWDVAGPPVPANGHCVAAVGYDEHGLQISTWGMLGTITWPALARYATAAAGGDLYAVLTPDQLQKGMAAAPNGVAWQQLIKDFDEIGRAHV